MERTLLLVDDEENIRRALVRVLRRDGYRILQAASGREGLAVLQEHPDIGVILSDQRMPEMTGIEFLSSVREKYPDTVCMILSGYTDLKTVTDAINKGAVYKFLTKPWEDDLLRANVEEAFRYYALGRENERLTQELKTANEELAAINQDLEKRVEEKTRQVMLNMHVLQISQEVLENLPAGVLGIDDDGVIVMANREAHVLLNANSSSIMGQDAVDVLPQAVCDLFQNAVEDKVADARGLSLGGVSVDVHCCQLGQTSTAKGMIVVITPAS